MGRTLEQPGITSLIWFCVKINYDKNFKNVVTVHAVL